VNHILVAALCLIPALASAWEPGELIDLPGTGDASVLHLGRLGDQPALVAAGPGGVFIVQNGAIVASDSQPASDAALLGGSVWTCAEDGIRRLDLSLEGFRAVELVSSEPCTALSVLYRGDDAVPWLLSAHTSLALWRVDGQRLVGPSRLGNRIEGHPIIATVGDNLAAVGNADSIVLTRSGRVRMDLPTGGRPSALALTDMGWVWSLPRTKQLALSWGEPIAVAPAPRSLATADLDGTGKTALLIAHPRALGRLNLATGEETLWPLDFSPMALAAADLNGDGCVDVAVLGANTTYPSLISGVCTGDVDAAPLIGELALQRQAWPELRVLPGEPLDVQLTWPGQPQTTAKLDGAPHGAALSSDGHLVFAPTRKDIGHYAISAHATRDDALLGGVFLTVVDADAKPTPLPPRPPEPRRVTVELDAPPLPPLQAVVGKPLALRLQHPDAQVYAADGGPPGLVARPDGRVDYTPTPDEEGGWTVHARWWEGDQPHEVPMTLTVHPSAATPSRAAE